MELHCKCSSMHSGINHNEFQRWIAVIKAEQYWHSAGRSRLCIRADCRAMSTDAHLICNIVHQTETMESYEVIRELNKKSKHFRLAN